MSYPADEHRRYHHSHCCDHPVENKLSHRLQGTRSFSPHATGLQNPLATPASSVNWALNRRLQHVAGKSKIESGKETDPAGLDPVARATEGIVESKPKRKTAPAASRKKKMPLKKKPASASKAPGAAKASRGGVSEPSDEEIRIRAYFIAERRLQLSLQGDSAHDWIEAKRQLVEEAKRAAS